MMDPRKGLRPSHDAGTASGAANGRTRSPKVSLVKPDDVPRQVPNRAEKRQLLRALRRLPAARTGRPWPLQRATGMPQWLADARLRALAEGFHDFRAERASQTGD